MEDFFFSGPFGVLFLASLLIVFSRWVRRMRWRELNRRYPLAKNFPGYEPVHLKYDRANINGLFEYNYVFSGIISQGVVIRKPFPFSLAMPDVGIRWEEVRTILVVNHINWYVKKPVFKWKKYADIDLKACDIRIRIRWKEKYREFVPEDKWAQRQLSDA